MAMTHKSVRCLSPLGFHNMAYVEWAGPPGAKTVVCVHGLTRNGRDFDPLAEALSERFRVVCPDIVGRGKSDWLVHGGGYVYPQYVADMNTLIARLDVEDLYWVGTSMGGLIAMAMASLPKSPIAKLVVNDIGPLIAKEGLERIGNYVGLDPSFKDLNEVEAYMREVAAPFGNLTDAQWRHMAVHGERQRPDGTIGLAYDPKIGDPFRNMEPKDIDLWPQWDAISCPTLLIRGAQSTLLKASDAEAMTQRGPKAKFFEVADAGHAPALMAADQIAAVRDFLIG